jgi:DnaJ-class molecular chaperone
MSSNASYYDILNVSQHASTEEISKAYKKAALKWHPDRHMTEKDAAEQMFKKISKAYEVLKDEQKRAYYDRFGGDESTNNSNNTAAAAAAAVAAEFLNPFNMFANIFRTNSNSNSNSSNSNQNTIITHTVRCSLAEMYCAGTKTETIQRIVFCKKCAATGFTDKQPHLCRTCNGQGVQMVAYQIAPNMFQQSTRSCAACKGTRTDAAAAAAAGTCGECKGHKKIKESVVLQIDLHEPSPMLFGDICVTVVVEPDAVYARKDNDLHRTVEISLRQALLGFTMPLDHLDGTTIMIVSRGVIAPGTTKKISNLGFLSGLGSGGKRGDYILQFIVEFPTKLNHKQQKALDLILPHEYNNNNNNNNNGNNDHHDTNNKTYKLEHVATRPTQSFYEDISETIEIN